MHVLNKTEALRFVRERAALFDHAEEITPFAGSAWTEHFIGEIAEDTWTIVVPESRTRGESVMLLYGDKRTPYRLSAVSNYYSSLYLPLVSSAQAPADRALALSSMVDQLVEQRPRYAVVNFAPLDADSADTAVLRRSFASRGWYAKQYDCFGNWYLPCAGLSFGDYMKSRDSKLFNTWTRKKKKFEARSAEGARLEIIVDPEQVPRAMDAYSQVYAKSWKKPEPYVDFVRNWAVICARNGWLRLGLAWMGTTPIAAQFWFTIRGHASIFKLAYEEDYQKLSAGTVLSAYMFERALDQDRVSEIDYLTGDDPYKQSWMTKRRQRVGIIACNPWTPRGMILGAKEFAGALRRDWRARRSIGGGEHTGAAPNVTAREN